MLREATERRASRFLIGLLLILAVAAVFLIIPFLTGIIFALVVGFLLQGPYNRVLHVVRYRPIAALLLMLGVALVLVLPFLFISYRLIVDGTAFLSTIDETGGPMGSIVNILTSFGVSETQAVIWVDSGLAKLSSLAQAAIVPTFNAILTVLANTGVFFFLLYFTLVDGASLGVFIRDAVPLPREMRTHLLDTIAERVRALFLGTFLVAFLQGGIAAVGWWIFGLPALAFWAFVMTILAVIPTLGPALIMVPAGAWLIFQGNVGGGIGVILYAVIVVSFSDNLVRPYILGRSANIHPALVLVGTLGGLVVFGITGFLLGPLILTMIEPVFAEWVGSREEADRADQLPPSS